MKKIVFPVVLIFALFFFVDLNKVVQTFYDVKSNIQNFLNIELIGKGDENEDIDSQKQNDNRQQADNGQIDDQTNQDKDIKVSSNSNYESIKLGDSLDSVISKIGQPSNVENSEYGFKWCVYTSDYNKFCMVGILENKVVALFSDSMNSAENNGIKLGDLKSKVAKNYKISEYRLKGNTRYMISEDYYHLIKTESKYITVFYDSFEGDKAVGIQIISKDVEDNLKGIYTQDDSLINNFENINRYLLNSQRAKNNLNTLEYSEDATICARAHSQDMRNRDFFSHNNPDGQTPFDRMKNHDISYRAAAENIAAGQFNGIFAHYALFNSEGHRVNMLGEYDYVGVGVTLGGTYNIYLTQNFYR